MGETYFLCDLCDLHGTTSSRYAGAAAWRWRSRWRRGAVAGAGGGGAGEDVRCDGVPVVA